MVVERRRVKDLPAVAKSDRGYLGQAFSRHCCGNLLFVLIEFHFDNIGRLLCRAEFVTVEETMQDMWRVNASTLD